VTNVIHDSFVASAHPGADVGTDFFSKQKTKDYSKEIANTIIIIFLVLAFIRLIIIRTFLAYFSMKNVKYHLDLLFLVATYDPTSSSYI